MTASKSHPRKVFKLADLNGDQVRGTFYPEEIQDINFKKPDKFIVEKVLRSRKLKGKTELLIKWKDYPSRLSTWIPESELKNYESI